MLLKTTYKTIKLDDRKMDYVKFGSGKKVLILIAGLSLNGLQGSKYSLAFMYKLFSKEYTVYVFERICDIPDGYTIKDMADDLARALEVLNIPIAQIFGISQGGMIAQYLAINYPHLVEKLVLALTTSRNNDLLEKTVNHWIDLAERKDYKSLVKDVLEKVYSEEYIKRHKYMIPLAEIFGKPNNPRRFINNAKACLTFNAYDDLKKIKAPSFVIGGMKDQIVGGLASEEIAEILNCQIYMYEDLGHGAYLEAKDFNKRIFEFLK